VVEAIIRVVDPTFSWTGIIQDNGLCPAWLDDLIPKNFDFSHHSRRAALLNVRLMNDEAFRQVAAAYLMRAVYEQVRAGG